MEPVFPFDLQLDRPGPGTTITHELRSRLRAAIVDGRLPAGTALPSTRQAAQALGIARNTVVAAYDLLVAEGWLLPRRAARPVVAALSAPRAAAQARPLQPGRERADARINPVWHTQHLQPPISPELPEFCFRLGVPDHRHFPHALWRRLSARSLRQWSRAPFSYPPSSGLRPLREAIAGHVAFARAVVCESRNVLVTSGSGQAFDLLARLLVMPGRTLVAVEEPGYPPVRAAFAAAGAELVHVPVDDEGICVDRLPDKVRVICVTPSHQCPTGVAMSMRRRAALLDFARARGAVIVEDDYDGEFRFGGRPLDALQTLDRDELVFYVGTFSKSLFPALRKGFIVCPAWARASLAYAKHSCDSHGDAIAQAVLADFIAEGHLARHVRHMQRIYAERRTVLLEGLKRELGGWLTPIPAEAGMHLAARINRPRQAARVIAAARLCTPGAQPIADYAALPVTQPALSFGYGVIDGAAIPPALARLRRMLEDGS